MIYGIGTDIVQISRVKAALERSGPRFAEKILGPEELVKYHARRAKNEVRGLRFLATRFSAKEAFSKAIGLGMRMPMTWRSARCSTPRAASRSSYAAGRSKNSCGRTGSRPR